MGDEVLVAIISSIGLILAGILVELVRGRRQLNQTLTDIDRRLIVVETTLGIRTIPSLPSQYSVHTRKGTDDG